MTNSATIARVLVADDHVAILAQIRNVLAAEFEIVGAVSNGPDLIKAAMQIDPDVVVLDITMPGLGSIEVSRRLRHNRCRAKTVFLTVHEDPDYVRTAMHSGGSAYVTKARMASDLIAAMREVLAGHRFVSPTIVAI